MKQATFQASIALTKKRQWIAGVLLGVMSFLSGCNTIEGLGKDVKKAGEKVEEAAKKR